MSPTLIAGLALPVSIPAAAVTVRFDSNSSETGPFPTDALTAADDTQKTGRRVNMPLPDYTAGRSDCENLRVLNRYDGFSLNPRLRVRFSGAIDVNTLRDGIFLVALQNLTNEEYSLRPAGGAISINQAIYDPATNTVYAKPDEILDQHRRYALVTWMLMARKTSTRIGFRI